MQFSEYQNEASKTDQQPLTDAERMKAIMVPLLGLAGETGSLLTHFKRYVRDGEAYAYFRERITEELGDVLWNVSNIATKADLSLDEIAIRNLAKIRDRWIDTSSGDSGNRFFDEAFPKNERFPRTFEISVASTRDESGRYHVALHYEDRPFGNDLTDNAEEDDGYRLHDVFHLGFLTGLGWSPVLRGKLFFNCKRRSNPDIDEIEDGGRAAVIDEAIAALIFVEAKKNSFYAGVDAVEYSILRTIKELTAHLEVRIRTAREWESAILSAFKVWRAIRLSHNGKILGNLSNRTLEFEPA